MGSGDRLFLVLSNGLDNFHLKVPVCNSSSGTDSAVVWICTEKEAHSGKNYASISVKLKGRVHRVKICAYYHMSSLDNIQNFTDDSMLMKVVGLFKITFE